MSKDEALEQLRKNLARLKMFQTQISNLETCFRGGDVSFSLRDALKEIDVKDLSSIISEMNKVVRARLNQRMKE